MEFLNFQFNSEPSIRVENTFFFINKISKAYFTITDSRHMIGPFRWQYSRNWNFNLPVIYGLLQLKSFNVNLYCHIIRNITSITKNFLFINDRSILVVFMHIFIRMRWECFKNYRLSNTSIDCFIMWSASTWLMKRIENIVIKF